MICVISISELKKFLKPNICIIHTGNGSVPTNQSKPHWPYVDCHKSVIQEFV